MDKKLQFIQQQLNNQVNDPELLLLIEKTKALIDTRLDLAQTLVTHDTYDKESINSLHNIYQELLTKTNEFQEIVSTCKTPNDYESTVINFLKEFPDYPSLLHHGTGKVEIDKQFHHDFFDRYKQLNPDYQSTELTHLDPSFLTMKLLDKKFVGDAGFIDIAREVFQKHIQDEAYDPKNMEQQLIHNYPFCSKSMQKRITKIIRKFIKKPNKSLYEKLVYTYIFQHDEDKTRWETSGKPTMGKVQQQRKEKKKFLRLLPLFFVQNHSGDDNFGNNLSHFYKQLTQPAPTTITHKDTEGKFYRESATKKLTAEQFENFQQIERTDTLNFATLHAKWLENTKQYFDGLEKDKNGEYIIHTKTGDEYISPQELAQITTSIEHIDMEYIANILAPFTQELLQKMQAHDDKPDPVIIDDLITGPLNTHKSDLSLVTLGEYGEYSNADKDIRFEYKEKDDIVRVFIHEWIHALQDNKPAGSGYVRTEGEAGFFESILTNSFNHQHPYANAIAAYYLINIGKGDVTYHQFDTTLDYDKSYKNKQKKYPALYEMSKEQEQKEKFLNRVLNKYDENDIHPHLMIWTYGEERLMKMVNLDLSNVNNEIPAQMTSYLNSLFNSYKNTPLDKIQQAYPKDIEQQISLVSQLIKDSYLAVDSPIHDHDDSSWKEFFEKFLNKSMRQLDDLSATKFEGNPRTIGLLIVLILVRMHKIGQDKKLVRKNKEGIKKYASLQDLFDKEDEGFLKGKLENIFNQNLFKIAPYLLTSFALAQLKHDDNMYISTVVTSSLIVFGGSIWAMFLNFDWNTNQSKDVMSSLTDVKEHTNIDNIQQQMETYITLKKKLTTKSRLSTLFKKDISEQIQLEWGNNSTYENVYTNWTEQAYPDDWKSAKDLVRFPQQSRKVFTTSQYETQTSHRPETRRIDWRKSARMSSGYAEKKVLPFDRTESVSHKKETLFIGYNLTPEKITSQEYLSKYGEKLQANDLYKTYEKLVNQFRLLQAIVEEGVMASKQDKQKRIVAIFLDSIPRKEMHLDAPTYYRKDMVHDLTIDYFKTFQTDIFHAKTQIPSVYYDRLLSQNIVKIASIGFENDELDLNERNAQVKVGRRKPYVYEARQHMTENHNLMGTFEFLPQLKNVFSLAGIDSEKLVHMNLYEIDTNIKNFIDHYIIIPAANLQLLEQQEAGEDPNPVLAKVLEGGNTIEQDKQKNMRKLEKGTRKLYLMSTSLETYIQKYANKVDDDTKKRFADMTGHSIHNAHQWFAHELPFQGFPIPGLAFMLKERIDHLINASKADKTSLERARKSLEDAILVIEAYNSKKHAKARLIGKNNLAS